MVQGSIEEDSGQARAREKILEKGFRKAVSLEIDQIIHAGISSKRKSALMDMLEERIQGLVQGYRQVSWDQTEDEITLQMEVNIDSESLRDMLQKAGVYYTIDSSWPYDLKTRGASPEDFHQLQKLQLVTGVVVDGSADTSLSLYKSADGQWDGNVDHEDIKFSVSADDLDEVWLKLWGQFFSRSEIRSSMLKNIMLETSGWVTTDSIMNFDRILNSWDKEVESAKIVSVLLDVNSLKAQWEIRSFSPEPLTKRLESYFPAREIEFSIDR
ncbi:MAG: hypothetical protein R6X11_07310 [Desulfonatronovibrio sp.]